MRGWAPTFCRQFHSPWKSAMCWLKPGGQAFVPLETRVQSHVVTGMDI